MRLLLTCASFLPSYGGPAVSVSSLARALAKVGHRVALWAPDGSAVSSPFVSRDDVEALDGRLETIEAHGSSVDLWHDNGIWLPHNHAIARLTRRRGIRRLVSVRGMLQPAALRHKGLKKRLAWAAYQRADLLSAAGLHATSQDEADKVRAFFPGRAVRVVPNGADIPEAAPARPKTVRTALFLGRLHPIKGLPMLLEAWRRTMPEGWRLVIAGPDEDGHRRDLEAQAASGGLAEVTTFIGPVEEDGKRQAFADADLFILPTHSENFGMAVAEALAHGLPVLTTTGAPWSVVVERGCGWWVEPSVTGLESGLRQATALGRPQLEAMGANGRRLIAERFSWEVVARDMTALYEDLVAGKGGITR